MSVFDFACLNGESDSGSKLGLDINHYQHHHCHHHHYHHQYHHHHHHHHHHQCHHQMESQMQAASSDWTNVIIPGSDTFVPGEQHVRWILIFIFIFSMHACMASSTLVGFSFSSSPSQNSSLFWKVASWQLGRRYQLRVPCSGSNTSLMSKCDHQAPKFIFSN